MAMTDDTSIESPTLGTPMINGVPLVPRTDFSSPTPETFETVEEERTHRKAKLAGALRIFGRFGFGEGVAGHITVRDPEFTNMFWVNPFGMSFRHIRSSDLILVNHDGEIMYGDGSVNRAAFVLHSAIHKARPDVIAAAHAHSTYGKAFSSLAMTLRPLTQDACAFYNDHVLISDHGGAVAFEPETGEAFARAFPSGKAAIHQNHGLFTVGETVDAACFWFVTMERNCQAQLAAMAAGDPVDVPDKYAQYTFEQTGYPLAGWFQFQPLWQEITRTDPDLFD